MPKGCSISFELRRLLHHHFAVKHFSVDLVFDLLFESDSTRVSKKHLKRLSEFFKSSSQDVINDYIFAPSERAGRKRKMDHDACQKLLSLQAHDPTKSIASTHATMKNDFYDIETQNHKHPCIRTTERAVKALGNSRKVLTIKNLGLNEVDVNIYFDKVVYFYSSTKYQHTFPSLCLSIFFFSR